MVIVNAEGGTGIGGDDLGLLYGDASWATGMALEMLSQRLKNLSVRKLDFVGSFEYLDLLDVTRSVIPNLIRDRRMFYEVRVSEIPRSRYDGMWATVLEDMVLNAVKAKVGLPFDSYKWNTRMPSKVTIEDHVVHLVVPVYGLLKDDQVGTQARWSV